MMLLSELWAIKAVILAEFGRKEDKVKGLSNEMK